MKSHRIVRQTILLFLFTSAIASVAALLTVSGTAVAAGSFAFTNYELASTPGVSCPGSTKCSNVAAEPAIRAAPDGTFYASSENSLLSGTDAWKSTDGGKHYKALLSPNGVSSATDPIFQPGGGDTDLAVAPAKNANGFYNVYVSSLTLANIDVSTSRDGGATWSLNAVSATSTGDDREWIAADGASKVCISYHDASANIIVNCSTNAGANFTQVADALDANHLFLVDNTAIGNLSIDPNNHYVYEIFTGLANASEVSCQPPLNCGFHAVYVAVSTDGGNTFTDYNVYTNPNNAVYYGHQFPNLALDRAGNLYAVFTDDHNMFYSVSTDHAQHWSAPVQVNKSPSNTAIFPWSVAGDAGKLDIVWYGTSYYDGTNSPDNYPASAAWYVYFAQNLKALTRGSTFTQVKASPIVHYGGVCESGVACTGNRDLYDDFGIAANPLTGLASIIYSDDQYAQTGGNQSGCTAANNNSGSCDHTSIATQTSGLGIYSKH